MTYKRKPERNWEEYNEHLVQRGEILISVESLSDWQKELRKMNEGKNGHPFHYPNSLIFFLVILRMVFSIPYRRLEGFARGLRKWISIPVDLLSKRWLGMTSVVRITVKPEMVMLFELSH